MFMALAVPADEAKSIVDMRALSSYEAPVPELGPAPPALWLDTSAIAGVSSSCCRFFSSVERRLAERLSLDASDVESGEFRSMDEAISAKRNIIYVCEQIKMVSLICTPTSSVSIRRASCVSDSTLWVLQRHHKLFLHLYDDLLLNVVFFIHRLQEHRLYKQQKTASYEAYLQLFLIFILDSAQQTLLLRNNLVVDAQLNRLFADFVLGAFE